ncbi:small subunit ribosomal protein S1 [Clostridium beijerinckii]|nr:small subunit ribosomal protein S1 [Clostridium beijerinckii]
MFQRKKNIKVHVKEETKGGVIAYYGNVRVFIPGSLASRERIELSSLVGRDLDVRITELDFKNKKVIASRRIIEEEEYNKNKKNIWDNLKEGEKRNGVVKKIVKFGAFVDIGGVEGLIHLSDLSWERVNKPEDIVKEGDNVEVFIGNVDRKNERLSLILKDVTKEPWTVHGKDINEGYIFEGKVIRLTTFGAFVELFDGIEGLVHITEITDEHIAKPSDVLEANQKVKVKVLSVNREEKRIALSIKEAVETNKEYLDYIDNSDESGTSLGDLLKGFKFE